MSSRLTEYSSTSTQQDISSDGDAALFLERLDAFLQKSLADIRAFAERESKSYEQTRRYVAEWHAQSLFNPSQEGSWSAERSTKINTILIETSKTLESLAETTNVQSFFLAVDPCNATDGGFLGGSVIGREFYRGLRGGGSTGASTFRTYAQKRVLPSGAKEWEGEDADVGAQGQDSSQGQSAGQRIIQTVPGRSARQVKVELYETVRSELRRVSGIRKAEMKWTNPERLSLYGVRMLGWPPDIPAVNPSNLKNSQNLKLLELVKEGRLRFEKTTRTGMEVPAPDVGARCKQDTAEEDQDISWAVDTDAAVPGSPSATTSAVGVGIATMPMSLFSSQIPHNLYNVMWNGGESEHMDEGNSSFETYMHPKTWEPEHIDDEHRVRKRRRSEE